MASEMTNYQGEENKSLSICAFDTIDAILTQATQQQRSGYLPFTTGRHSVTQPERGMGNHGKNSLSLNKHLICCAMSRDCHRGRYRSLESFFSRQGANSRGSCGFFPQNKSTNERLLLRSTGRAAQKLFKRNIVFLCIRWIEQ